MSEGADVNALDDQIAALLKQIRPLAEKYRRITGQFAPALLSGKPSMPTQDLLTDMRVVLDRYEIIRALPHGMVIGEVGTLTGRFAEFIHDTVKPEALHVIDLSFHHIPADRMERLKSLGVQFHKGYSWDQIASFPNHYFDVLYIDADHAYESVMKDLEASMMVIKAGGLLICNDYTRWSASECRPYGVYWAVNAIACKYQLRFEKLALQMNGYFDVSLRVPR